MGIDRDIFPVELPGENLFDPKNVVINQENDLFETRGVAGYAVRNTFVYHKKGGTVQGGRARQNINLCHNNYLKMLAAQLNQTAPAAPAAAPAPPVKPQVVAPGSGGKPATGKLRGKAAVTGKT